MFLTRFSEIRFNQIDIKLELIQDELKEVKIALNLLLLTETRSLHELKIEKRSIQSMTAELQALADQISINTSVEKSGTEMINRLADKVAQLAAAGDMAGIVEFTNQLKSSAGPLLAAVTANTPAASVP